jgi:hypothetical protein
MSLGVMSRYGAEALLGPPRGHPGAAAHLRADAPGARSPCCLDPSCRHPIGRPSQRARGLRDGRSLAAHSDGAPRQGTPTTALKVTQASYPATHLPEALLDRRHLDLTATCQGTDAVKLALPTQAGGEFAAVACATTTPAQLFATSSTVTTAKLGIATLPTTSWRIILTTSTRPEGQSSHALPTIPHPHTTSWASRVGPGLSGFTLLRRGRR